MGGDCEKKQYNDEKEVEPLKTEYFSVMMDRREIEKQTGNISLVAMGGMMLKSIVQFVWEHVLTGMWYCRAGGSGRAAGES